MRHFRSADDGRADGPAAAPTLASLNTRNNPNLDPVTQMPIEKNGKKSSGVQVKAWFFVLAAKAETDIAAVNAAAQPASVASLADPAW